MIWPSQISRRWRIEPTPYRTAGSHSQNLEVAGVGPVKAVFAYGCFPALHAVGTVERYAVYGEAEVFVFTCSWLPREGSPCGGVAP